MPRSSRRVHRRAVVACAVALVLVASDLGVAATVGVGGALAAPPAGPGPYAPPVDAPVVDPFRPPPTPYGPGNRGLTYGVAPLTPVRAAGDGEVVFAGQVGASLHVTIRHPDGLRTSYSFLAATSVRAGGLVRQGDLVGWSSEVLHLGVRTPDGTYLDPELLWRRRWEPRLVPGGDDGALAPPEPVALLQVVRERTGPLAAWLASGGATIAGWSTEAVLAFDRRLRLWMHIAAELDPATHLERALAGFDRWWDSREACTGPEVVAAPPAERRIVVEVGGIGSTSDGAAIERLDTVALGYDAGDVIRFSYEGGRIPPAEGLAADPFAGLTTTEYHEVASQGDLDESGRRLAALLDDVARAAPGVPIDVIAHSQGGVVSRLALEHARRTATLPAEVQNLVTLGSPHQGADLATAIEAVGTDPTAAATLDLARRRLGVELDPALPAASQLSEVSPVIDHLRTLEVPPGIRFTSIAARGDVVVTEGRTAAPGARRSTVTLTGIGAHDHLPESPEATREVLLALAGRAPTCRSLPDTMLDVVVGDGLGRLEDGAAAAALGLGAGLPG
jgi:hypothetical protein